MKHVYLDRAQAKEKARAFLANASGPGQVAGRQIALLAMARYADEGAVAQSARAFYELTPGPDLSWSIEAIDQLDALDAEKLPEHVLERGRQQRERQAAARAKAREDEAWLQEQYAALAAMSADERTAVLAEHEERFGPYGGQRWQLEARIRELAEASESDASEAAADPEGGDA